MLYEIALIFVSMLASIGLCELVLYMFIRKNARELSGRIYIIADGFGEDEAEFVIRRLEGVLSLSGLDVRGMEICLGENARIDPYVLEKLCREFGNIRMGA